MEATNWTPVLVYAPLGAGMVLVAAHLVPYFLDPHNYRRPAITGPWLSALSDSWLSYVAAQGNRSGEVHKLHEKYGKFVRIAPNHISIADPEALQASLAPNSIQIRCFWTKILSLLTVYAHGNGTLKPRFYDAFVSIREGIFSTRDRAAHARKRRIVSHVFSQQNVRAFEPHIRRHVRNFCAQWDRRCELAAKGEDGPDWEARRGKAWFDCLPHFNYLAFDIIGDLAFGSPFGMIAAQRDSAPMFEHIDGKDPKSSGRQVKHVPAIRILNNRGNFAASLGVMPSWWWPLARLVPWYAKGNEAVECLAGLAVAAVAKRLEDGLPDEEDDEDEAEEGVKVTKKRTDLLERLMQGKDEHGMPMGPEELTAEALTHLIAGSDTTSKQVVSSSACAITYYLAANPYAQRKLQAELDEHLSPAKMSSPATSYEKVKSLSYLNACINEGMRLHSTSSLGLPRVVPPGTVLEVCGEKFGPGSILSVPSFTLHRYKEVWGEDAGAFRPERWLEAGVDIQAGVGTGRLSKAFNPFSYGPRGCLGRNVASMELQIMISSVFTRYEFELLKPNEPLGTCEGFLRKPLNCYIGIKRREVVKN